MARSLGFAAYRAFSRRLNRPAIAPDRPRPDGEVLWLHAASVNRLAALRQLGRRVQGLRDDLVVLITSGKEIPKPEAPGDFNLWYDRIYSDHPGEILQFLDHWRPDICLWAGAELMPNLISQTNERNIPLFLIDIGQNEFPSRNHRWFPDLTRETLGRFETILTTGPEVSPTLRRIGVPHARITAGEPLRNGPSPEPVDEFSLAETAQQLGGRPLWHAAHVQADEFEAVFAAHRTALALIHRLLLVVSVADAAAMARADPALGDAGLRHVFWQAGEAIDDNTQVLICDGADDLGLWYRMAPLTFMASSLNIECTGHDPLEAVALGSAIVFGPHVGVFRETYARLALVGAGQSVGNTEGLGMAVIDLVAPDRAAAMALQGWQVVTEGAALTDRLVDLVQDRLDSAAASHARP